jgi:hypothetical protein
LSILQVIDAYTRTGAYASFDEARFGAIEPGKLADLVILSDDVFATPPATADAVHVDTTIFAGRIVFSRK